MRKGQDMPVAIGLRFYRALANAFPHEFKNAYGDEMLQVTGESIEEIWRHHGMLGLVRLLADVAVRLTAEYASEIRRDVRYGLRALARSPGFTLVAVISLSLGICVATCAYSELHGLLRDLPDVPRPDELVLLQPPASFPDYRRYEKLSGLFSSTFAYVAPVPLSVSGGGRPERAWGHLVTGGYFPTLGVRPALGRLFDAGDLQPGRSPAAVVSDRFWREHLGADPSIVGKSLRVNGSPAVVIGVGPKEFLGASPSLFPADVWLPVTADARVAPELSGNALERRDLAMFQVVGRLRPGVSEAAAEAQLDAVAQQLQQSYGDARKDDKTRRVLLVSGGRVIPVRKQDMPFLREFFLILGGLVLLIACANLANMMLARAADRRREIAVRLALGAGRGRLIRQLLVESLLVAAAAAVPGYVLCIGCMHLLSRVQMPMPIPVRFDLTPDWHALVFTSGLMLFTGMAFGLLPALQATRPSLAPALKEGGHLPLRKFRRMSLRNALVLSQMAGSLMLLLLTGYLALGIQSTLGVQQGFDPRDLYLVSLDPVRDGYAPARAADFFERLLARVRRLPAVTAACLTDTVPAAIDGNAGVTFWISGTGQPARLDWARKHTVGRDYFETAGIAILSGRGFRREDESGGARAVIVSRTFAGLRSQWGSVLGRRIELGNGQTTGSFGAWPGTLDLRPGMIGQGRDSYEIVGIVEDVTEDVIVSKRHPAVYFPLRTEDYGVPSLRGVTLLFRAAPGVDAIGAVRREISTLDASVEPFNARSMAEHIAQFMSALKGASWTYGFIGVFGLVLAAVGLAGVTAYTVAQRSHEIGIRLALGAQKRDVLGLVMKEGAALVAVGAVLGLAFAWACMRALSGMFFSVASVQGYDPVLLAGAPLLLAGLALAACYVPARRSMRVDPVRALRQE